MAMLFDTLEASRQLQEAGFEKAKADALVTTFSRNMVENVATRDDLTVLGQRLTIRFGASGHARHRPAASQSQSPCIAGRVMREGFPAGGISPGCC